VSQEEVQDSEALMRHVHYRRPQWRIGEDEGVAQDRGMDEDAAPPNDGSLRVNISLVEWQQRADWG
jgi:hypothetical protein